MKLLVQINRLKTQFPVYPINRVRLDNIRYYSSHAFNTYCISIDITIEHQIAHVHTQNDLINRL
jgi:hypothetical protein